MFMITRVNTGAYCWWYYTICVRFFSCVFFLSVCVRWDLVHVSRFKEIFKPSFSATCEGHSPRFPSCKLRKKDKKETLLKEDIYRRGIKTKNKWNKNHNKRDTYGKTEKKPKWQMYIWNSRFRIYFSESIAFRFNGFEH